MGTIKLSEMDTFVKNSHFNSVVVTLYEGHYHIGVGALINSLSKSGFNGLIRIGYKGELPKWTNQLKKQDEGLYSLDENCLIHFIKLDTNMHFGYYKPYFMKETFTLFPSAEKVYYFDPDIVVLAPWNFYNDWAVCGVALCLDNCFPFVFRNHPWRTEWKTLGNANSNTVYTLDQYANSGFVGLHRKEMEMAETWITLTESYRSKGGDLSQFEKDSHRAFKGDQDLMNAALTVLPHLSLSIIGSEGMGFSFPANIMAHAVGDVKPWKQNFLYKLIIKGLRPSYAEKRFLEFSNYPIVLFSPLSLFIKKFNIKFSSLLGRLLS